MSSIRVLTSLQAVDSDIRSHRTVQEELQRQLDDIEQLEALKEQVAGVQSIIADLEKEQREADGEAEGTREQLQGVEAKLYSGSIRIPKELVALQQDAAMIKTRLEGQDERVLGLMTRLEEQRGMLEGLKTELAQVEAERSELERKLGAELSQLASELDQLNVQRLSLTTQVSSSDLALYESLLNAKQGRAVARIERATCQGCRINLPTTVQHRVRSAQILTQCPSCSRVLYMD